MSLGMVNSMAGDTDAGRLVRDYVTGWKAADSGLILDTLERDCIVIESHGPTYRGRDQVERWVESWFAEGNTIDRWDITSLLVADDDCAFEWDFSCTVGEVERSFEGASVARLKGGRIALLREYRMTQRPFEWTG